VFMPSNGADVLISEPIELLRNILGLQAHLQTSGPMPEVP
jgi:hypothetical protein